MSFLGSVKNFVSNPARVITAVGTFGASEALRAISPKAGNAFTNIYGGTVTGTVVGFALGGPGGAVVGGTTGLARGVYGAYTTGNPNKTLLQSAEAASITSSIYGAAAKTGFAGSFVGRLSGTAAKTAVTANPVTAGVGGAVTAAGAPVAAASSSSGILSSLGSIALLSALQRPSGQPGLPGPDVSVTSPGGGVPNNLGPSNGPLTYPSLSGGAPKSAMAAASSFLTPTTTIFLGATAILAFLFFKQKHA